MSHVALDGMVQTDVPAATPTARRLWSGGTSTLDRPCTTKLLILDTPIVVATQAVALPVAVAHEGVAVRHRHSVGPVDHLTTAWPTRTRSRALVMSPAMTNICSMAGVLSMSNAGGSAEHLSSMARKFRSRQRPRSSRPKRRTLGCGGTTWPSRGRRSWRSSSSR